MLELLILLSSDISLYRDTFDMMHRYTWSLYHPISNCEALIAIVLLTFYISENTRVTEILKFFSNEKLIKC